jgi:putative transposase
MADDRLDGRPGAPACGRSKRGQDGEEFGRSKGGFSTKVHVAVDGLGNPLSPGQAADVTHAPSLIEGLRFDALLADKGYDADWLVDLVKSTHHAEPVIPPRKGRKQPRDYDRHAYKQRNLVERFIGWAKHFRRAATRYEKTARNFLAVWNFVAIMKLLK